MTIEAHLSKLSFRTLSLAFRDKDQITYNSCPDICPRSSNITNNERFDLIDGGIIGVIGKTQENGGTIFETRKSRFEKSITYTTILNAGKTKRVNFDFEIRRNNDPKGKKYRITWVVKGS
jgi:hypothetical protein